jgi:two-component system, NtrC family, nitrogen regulation response regulator NtrX
MKKETAMKRVVLVVDDEERVRKSLVQYLGEEGFTVLEAKDPKSADEALARAGGSVDLILLDVRMPGEEDGLDYLKRSGDLVQRVPVIMMSGHGTIELAVEAVRHGAFDFLEKGFTPERLTLTVERALEITALKRQNQVLREERGALYQMVGTSKVMDALREAVKRAAPTPAKVLILGENGVGKELVARAIHDLSPRHDGPFVRLNCAAIPKELVESELFGHERGAFTGADARKQGKVEMAQGGTLFLDEIGDMSLDAQAKLLRALESSEFERVGGTRTLTFDARFIAATNKDLKTEVTEHRFRQDLFYRLNVIPIEVPPLRERVEDIPLLVDHYLGYFRGEYGRPRLKLGAKAVDLLCRHSWPGNVRELRNVVERLVIMAQGEQVLPEDVALVLESSPGMTEAVPGAAGDGGESGGEGHLKEMLDHAEKQILEAELVRSGGNVSQAARNLGIDRANFHRKMRRLGIERGK